jgi:N-methylhydantoinase B/oxoprolinase/acetone carboxylase alpha subunit
LIRRYRITGETVNLTTMVERCLIPPPGLHGGSPGALSEIWLERDGGRESIPGKSSLELRAGDVIEILTAGGGGWGSV